MFSFLFYHADYWTVNTEIILKSLIICMFRYLIGSASALSRYKWLKTKQITESDLSFRYVVQHILAGRYSNIFSLFCPHLNRSAFKHFSRTQPMILYYLKLLYKLIPNKMRQSDIFFYIKNYKISANRKKAL